MTKATVAIRMAEAGDAGAIADIYAPFVAADATSFETEPPSADEMRRRIADTTVTYPWLVCERDGVIAGYAYATRHRTRAAYQWCVETSVYVHPDLRRTGVARGLYTSLVAILAAQGFVNAYAGITLPNARSVALHEKLGFLPLTVYRGIGFKAGHWHDVGWWHLIVSPHPASPEPPKPLADIRRQPEWDELVATGLPYIRAEALGRLDRA
jgi:L-amino acid N-acyltransferase YncA